MTYRIVCELELSPEQLS